MVDSTEMLHCEGLLLEDLALKPAEVKVPQPESENFSVNAARTEEVRASPKRI